MSTAQVVFAIALGAITLLITFFAFFVLSTTIRGDRWIRRQGMR